MERKDLGQALSVLEQVVCPEVSGGVQRLNTVFTPDEIWSDRTLRYAVEEAWNLHQNAKAFCPDAQIARIRR